MQDDSSYQIVANLKVIELSNQDVKKLFKCTAKLKDSEDGFSVENNHCEDQDQAPDSQTREPASRREVTEELIGRTPIKLENEVQSDTVVSNNNYLIHT